MDRLPCEFFLIRYVPDVVKGEFVNIGVLLREAALPDPAAPPRSAVRFTRDWSRVRCMDAEADVDLLEGLEGEIAARLQRGVSPREPKGVLEMLRDTLSNSVQITEARATLAESLPAGMEQLLRMYVEPLKAPRTRSAPKTGRTAITGAMRTAFERAGVWGLMRKRIAASPYTRPGDPLRIDCGYRPDGAGKPEEKVRLFQAVSLAAGDLEAPKGLAFSAPHLAEGVRRVEGAGLELTAVVEPLREVGDPGDPSDEAAERFRFAVETMEERAIRVVTVNDLARVAETARRELGM